MSRHWVIRAALVSAAAVGSFAVGACGSEDGGGATGEGGQSLRIGLAQPLTGPVAAAGIAVRDGAKIAVQEINGAGGVKGRKLELAIEDDANDPATCTSVAQKLTTQDQVPVIIGFWGSSCTLPAIPILERAGIPLVVETSGAPAITDPEEAWTPQVFRLAPTGSQEAAALAKVLTGELQTKSVFQLLVNNDFGRSFADAYTAELKKLGVAERGRALFDQADQDFSTQVTKAKRSGADTIIVITDVGQIATILKEMKAQGVQAKVFTSGGSNNPEEVVRLAGPRIAEDHYASVYFPYFAPSRSAAPGRTEKFVKQWTAEGHKVGEITEAARGYDAVYTVAEAVKRAEDPADPEAITKALANVSLKGIMFGDIKFQGWESLKQQNVQTIYVSQVADGKPKVVGEAKP